MGDVDAEHEQIDIILAAMIQQGYRAPEADLSVVTPLSSDDAYRSETLPNSKYDRSNLSPSQDAYANNTNRAAKVR